MKKSLFLLAGLAFVLTACHHSDSLIGNWTVDKVNVQFDESRVTPEIVKQIGEMERQNTFSINPDSSMVFKGLDIEWQGIASLRGDTTLRCDGRDFGTWSHGQIVTRIDTPVGEVVVIYKKE